METVNIHQLGYRFSEDEFAALLALNGLSGLTGLTAEADGGHVERGLEALEAASVLSRTGGELRLESVTAFLARQIAEATAWVTVRTPGRALSVRFARRACILLERADGGPWLICPFPDAAAARAPFSRALKALGPGWDAEVFPAESAGGSDRDPLDEFDRLDAARFDRRTDV